jgi:hypothetical protein
VTAAALAAVAALPVLPTASCPTLAAALGAAGLGPACQLAGGAGSVAGSAVSGLASAGVDSVLNGLGSWVASGASWLLGQIGAVIGATTTVDLGAQWFGAHYETMAALAGTVVLPLLLLGVMQAIYRQSASMLLRTVLVHLPLSILLTAVAVKLVELGLALTDAMSATVASGAGLDAGHFMGTVSDALTGTPAAGAPGAPAFVLFLGALAVVAGAVLVWIELLLRAAAVYVAVLFLPLALASLAWPAIAHWCRRLVDTLAALVLGKFVIVSVLSLAAGALAGGTGSVPSGARPGTGGSGPTGAPGAPGSGGFSAVLGGAALLLLAALAPWALFRLLPFMEAGAVAHLEGVSHRARQSAAVPVRNLAQVAMRASGAAAFEAGATGGGLAGGARAGSGAGTGAGAAGAGAAGAAGAAVGALRGGNGSSPRPSEGTPDPGPSSVETTGVGAAEAPGSSIPTWEPNERATAAARYYLDGGTGTPEGIVLPALDYPVEPAPDPDPAPAPGPAGVRGLDAPVLLPRATGTDKQHWLGSDALGPKLIAGPDPTARRRPPIDGDG